MTATTIWLIASAASVPAATEPGREQRRAAGDTDEEDREDRREDVRGVARARRQEPRPQDLVAERRQARNEGHRERDRAAGHGSPRTRADGARAAAGAAATLEPKRPTPRGHGPQAPARGLPRRAPAAVRARSSARRPGAASLSRRLRASATSRPRASRRADEQRAREAQELDQDEAAERPSRRSRRACSPRRAGRTRG